MKLTKGKKQRKRNKKLGTKSIDKLLHFSLIKMDFFSNVTMATLSSLTLQEPLEHEMLLIK